MPFSSCTPLKECRYDNSNNSQFLQFASTTLENGLKKHFSKNGYPLAQDGYELRARIVNLSRGSSIANAIVGLGVGKDGIDVEVQLRNKARDVLMSFNVVGEVLDKRYADMREMLIDEIPEKVVEMIKSWGSATNK